MPNYLHSFIKKLRGGIRPRPSRDWLIIVVLFGVALLIILVLSIVSFQNIVNGDKGSASVTTSPQVIDRAALDKIQKIFEKRAIEKEKYTTGDYSYTDPSQ